MSNRYKGGIISATPPTTTGGESGVASGAWTLEQQMQAQAAGLWPSQPPPPYIEDVFSTYLYTGNASARTITNGINLATNGGLVWMKGRSAAENNYLQDTVRGINSVIYSNLTNASGNPAGTAISSFNTTGFSLGTNTVVNNAGDTYVSWTFRKQPKFFDVVTYTGNGSVDEYQAINHSLASNPACIILKRTDTTSNWIVLHQQDGGAYYGVFRLNTSGTRLTQYLKANYPFSNTQFPAFDVSGLTGNASDNMNASGGTYVAYVFASNAGGFGPTETDNVITCGTYTGNGSASGPTITLGYEPQFVIYKCTDVAYNWYMVDTMRGMPVADVGTALIKPNTSEAEFNLGAGYTMLAPTATGFQVTSTDLAVNQSTKNYIYIAIRRPMKVPTSGTSVFTPVAYTGDGTTRTQSVGFPTDLSISKNRAVADTSIRWTDRLRGNGAWVASTSTGSENAQGTDGACFDNQTNIILATDRISSGVTYVNYSMRRAPNFFDEVCYTGDGTSYKTLNHNLGAIPDLLIVKSRSAASTNWVVTVPNAGLAAVVGILNTTAAFGGTAYNNGYLANNDATTFYAGFGSTNNNAANASGSTYVAYLFATCPGVSKVGSYTGTGTTQTINCGFLTGARFVMIKRTDSTGDWYVWDSARGIIPSNDPYLLINSTAAEVTGTDYVDTSSTGFDISSTAPAAINASGGTFIFLAIA
jgi:hypothetical protein